MGRIEEGKETLFALAVGPHNRGGKARPLKRKMKIHPLPSLYGLPGAPQVLPDVDGPGAIPLILI